MDCADAELVGEFLDSPTQRHARKAVAIVANLHIGPVGAAPPASAETLQHGLLGRPASGEVFHRPLAALAVADLVIGVDAHQEHLAVFLDHAGDAQALDDVSADSNDFHDRSPSLGVTLDPTDLS